MKHATKYITAFLITAVMFVTAMVVSDELEQRRTVDIGSIRNGLSLQLASDELEDELRAGAECDLSRRQSFGEELGALGVRITYLEEQKGSDDIEVMQLKAEHSLLQIRDYLLTKAFNEKCEDSIPTVVAFLANDGCEDCLRAWHRLSAFQQEYPEVRLYAFDTLLDMSIIRTFRDVLGGSNEQIPVIFFNDELLEGSLDELPEELKRRADLVVDRAEEGGEEETTQ